MKIQFAGDTVRIRVARDAFDRLRDGAELRFELPLGPGGFAVALLSGDTFRVAGGAGLLSVTLPERALAGLAGRLPCKDGLEFPARLAGRSVVIALEVDVRAARRTVLDDGTTR